MPEELDGAFAAMTRAGAEALGITITPPLLFEADEVIQ
jgi:hypothetical protein